MSEVRKPTSDRRAAALRRNLARRKAGERRPSVAEEARQPMLFMVIEHFRQGPDAVGERFRAQDRLMPEGLKYISSWVEPSGERCFQLMEAPDVAAFDPWIERWSDLITFEISQVEPSEAFWARRGEDR